MNYEQLVLDNESLLTELPAELQQSAGSLLVRSLPQLHAESTRFAVRQTTRPDADTAQAQLVLARAGFDLTREKRNLDKIDLSAAYEDFEPASDQNLERYLDYQHSLLVNSLIEENNNKITKAFRRNCESQLEHDWRQQKNRLLRNLRLNFSEGGAAPVTGILSESMVADDRRTLSLSPSALETPARPATANPSVTKELIYAQAVEKIVTHKGNASQLFAQASRSIDEYLAEKDGKISFVWSLLEEFSFTTGSEGVCPAPSSSLVKASIRFLSAQYKSWLLNHVARIRIGGRLGLSHQIRAFLREQLFRQRFPAFLANSPEIEGVPLWPQIFFCIRCADYDEALELARVACRRYPEHPHLGVFCSTLAAYTQEHAHGPRPGPLMPLHNLDELRECYNTFVRDADDPFEVAVYNVVGRGALEQLHTIKYRQTTQKRAIFQRYITSEHTDYMWLQLSLLNPSTLERSLAELQEQTRGFEQHFSRNQTDPPLYFLVLVLTLQCSAAVTYLLSTASYRVEAVHFSIALDELGLLTSETFPGSADELGVMDDIIGQYVFETPSVACERALHYVLLLLERHPAYFDKRFIELLVGNRTPIQQAEVVRKLVGRGSGLARDHVPHERIDRLCLAAADKANKDESFLVASELYDIAEPQAIESLGLSLLHLLSRHLSSVSQPVRRLAAEKVKRLLSSSISSSSNARLSDRTRDALDILFQLVEFFNANATVRFDDALEIAGFCPSKNSGLVALNSKDMSSALERFQYLNEVSFGSLARVLPDVATITMKILYNKFEITRSRDHDPRNPAGTSLLREIREQAQSLHTFYLKLESKGVVGSYAESFGKFFRGICY